MSVKKTGFNAKLRSLFARIQRQVSYPKVIAVKPHIQSRVRTWRDQVDFKIRTVAAPTTSVRGLEVDFPFAVVEGSLENISCHHAELMESLETTAHSVTCWEANETVVHGPELELNFPAVKSITEPVKKPKVKKQPLRFPLFGINTLDVSPKARVFRGINMALDLPMRLRIQPMDSISKKLLIRYRTSVLKSLNIKPNQVKFVGVCFGLPAAPLRIMDVARGVDGEYALATIVGPVNEMLGRRVWVLVQLRDKPRYVPITLKEE